MGDKTKIEWTDATWNPVSGCSKVSAGCKNCYAERLFHRPYPDRDFTDVRTHSERLEQPLRWRRPRKIFVNSMSDLFHEEIEEEFIGHVFEIMSRCPQHTFQVLTKRASEMYDLLAHAEERWGPFEDTDDNRGSVLHRPSTWPLRNVWLGVSVENQKTADERIPLLLETPAAIRFVSYEPALGSVDFSKWLDIGKNWDGMEARTAVALDWVIAGGESGPRARPSHPDWFRSVRNQCQTAAVPFFFKQWGEWAPRTPHRPRSTRRVLAAVPFFFKQWGEWAPRTPDTENASIVNVEGRLADGGKTAVFRWGKQLAGRVLDGREWNEFPSG